MTNGSKMEVGREGVVTSASYSSRLLIISGARGGNGRARLTSAKAGHRLQILDNNNNGDGGGAALSSPFPSSTSERSPVIIHHCRERGRGARGVAQFANLRYHTRLIHFVYYLMEISVLMVSEGYF